MGRGLLALRPTRMTLRILQAREEQPMVRLLRRPWTEPPPW